MNIELGLDRIKRLLMKMGNPERSLKVIHVAGTNGKGSTIAYINSILMEKGIRTGRYISPAVFDDMEIIQINGRNIDRQEFEKRMSEIEEICSGMDKKPTAFEKQTALAIKYFFDNKCEVCIIEVGMGGQGDATNVFKKVLCSVITSVALDHTEFLGETIEEIARCKSGIIKRYCPVIVGTQPYEQVYNIMEQKAKDSFSRYIRVEKNKVLEDSAYAGLKPKNMAVYQYENISIAIETIRLLNEYEYNISNENIVTGINKTVWMGRFEKICENPPVYIDGAHNPDGALKLKETISTYFKHKKVTFIMGIFADKDYKKVVEIMAPLAENIYTITIDNERALDGRRLADEISVYNKNVRYCESLKEACKMAVSHEDNVIVAFGSLSYLKAVKGCIKDENR